jgi:hypothetical protein
MADERGARFRGLGEAQREVFRPGAGPISRIPVSEISVTRDRLDPPSQETAPTRLTEKRSARTPDASTATRQASTISC